MTVNHNSALHEARNAVSLATTRLASVDQSIRSAQRLVDEHSRLVEYAKQRAGKADIADAVRTAADHRDAEALLAAAQRRLEAAQARRPRAEADLTQAIALVDGLRLAARVQHADAVLVPRLKALWALELDLMRALGFLSINGARLSPAAATAFERPPPRPGAEYLLLPGNRHYDIHTPRGSPGFGDAAGFWAAFDAKQVAASEPATESPSATTASAEAA